MNKGCPFASMRDVELEALLKNLHVDSDHIGNILQYHREKNYEVNMNKDDH